MCVLRMIYFLNDVVPLFLCSNFPWTETNSKLVCLFIFIYNFVCFHSFSSFFFLSLARLFVYTKYNFNLFIFAWHLHHVLNNMYTMCDLISSAKKRRKTMNRIYEIEMWIEWNSNRVEMTGLVRFWFVLYAFALLTWIEMFVRRAIHCLYSLNCTIDLIVGGTRNNKTET